MAKVVPPSTAPGSMETQIEEVSLEQGEPRQDVRVGKSPDDLLGKLGHEIFKYDCLDRKLKRHHVTGKCPIDCLKGCSLTVDRNRVLGCGWYWSLSDFGTDCRPRRSYWRHPSIPIRRSYDFRGYAIARRDGQCETGSRSDHGLSRRVRRRGSWVRSGFDVLVRLRGPGLALFSQSVLIGENRLANCISMVTLTIAAAMFTQYWGSGFGVAPATFVLLLVIALMNACGVQASSA